MQITVNASAFLQPIMLAEDCCDDPTQLPNNVVTQFGQADDVVAATSAVTRKFNGIDFHYNVKTNAAGLMLSISAWGLGTSGPVGGF